MTLPQLPDPAQVPDETQRRLILSRAFLVAGEALVVLLAPLFSIHLPMAPMLAIIGLHGLLNLAALHRLRQGRSGLLVVALELGADTVAIATLVYFSGGYANPFISLLLLPLILAAVALPARHAWIMTAWVAVLYSLLARYYQPLTLMVDSQAAIDLHLAGMWLNFLFTAFLVAAFLARLMRALRQQDAALALAREKALRDEHLFSLGMQAATAAHDLATPLATLSISVGELEREFAGDDQLGPPLAVMRSQTERMKAVLGRLAAAAGAQSHDPRQVSSLTDWLSFLYEAWRLMWPEVRSNLILPESPQDRRVTEDPMLVSVIASLLNNAARASPQDVVLEASWDARTLVLRILDRGPGMPKDEPESGGQSAGWGVGLRLARAALERYAGQLDMTPRPGGGLAVTVSLPLAALEAET